MGMNDTSDLRATIEAAVEEHENKDTSAEVSEGLGAVSAPAPSPAPSPSPTDARDVAASAPAAPPMVQTAEPQNVATLPVMQPAPAPNGTDKAPGSWTPAAREKWATTDPEVKQEIWKREREAQRALTQSSEARKFSQEFNNTIQPFLGFIAAENSTPLQAVQHMMQTAALLRVGTPQQKVTMVADLIRSYGIDLHALDSVLAGQMPQFNPQMALQQEIQRQLQPVQQLLQTHQTQAKHQEQLLEQEVASEWEQFSSQNEFAEDLRETMADLIEIATRRGQHMGLTEAYERATLMHEPVRRVIEGRKQAQAAQEAAKRARNARNAAGSITPSSETGVVQPVPGDSIRSALEFAIAQQQGR